VAVRTCAGDGAAAEPGGAVHPIAPAGDDVPCPPQLLPLALLSTASASLRAPGWAGPPPGCQLWLRLHGQVMQLRCDESGAVTLPALDGVDGAAHIWVAQEGAPGGASRTVLLTRDAGIAAEVASLNADDATTQRLLCALGAALRPACAPRVLAAAAAEALSRGWVAAASRLLPLLRAALDAGACDADARAAARMMLHAAALSGSPALVQLTLSLLADGALGSPYAQDARRVTPMHLAATAGDGDVAAVLAGASPAALVAWFCARSVHGATPADAALAAGGAVAVTHAALARRLTSARVLAAELAAARHDDAANTDDAAAPHQPFDDAALARFLLRFAAPSDPAAPAAPGERALYEKQRFMSRRLWALCFPPLAIMTSLRNILTPRSNAAVPPAMPTWHEAWALYAQQPRMMVDLALNVGLFLFVALPQLRGAYERHGVAVLRMFSVLQFMLLPAVSEWCMRRVLGFTILWPAFVGVLFQTGMTVNMALLPLPCRDSVALLVARWALMVLTRVTGTPLWPSVTAPLQAAMWTTLVNAALSVAVVVMDRRAWAAWRLGRRARLANTLLRKQV
jgi:hypothetical protein